MTDIKRYETVIGEVVKYTDHAAIVVAKDARIAALQALVRELAAEAGVLKNYIKSECFIVEIGAHPMAEADISAEERMPETPATDAAIREIRAQAVDDFSASVQGGHAEADRLKHLASHYAARIRSGEQP